MKLPNLMPAQFSHYMVSFHGKSNNWSIQTMHACYVMGLRCGYDNQLGFDQMAFYPLENKIPILVVSSHHLAWL